MKAFYFISAMKNLFKSRRSKTNRLGSRGEKLAAKHLKSLGLKIIRKNYSTALGEIDIIAREKDTLVFVEVKSRSGGIEGSAEYSVDRKKRYRIARTALRYLNENKIGSVDCRFDVVTVLFSALAAPRVNVIKNAFPIR